MWNKRTTLTPIGHWLAVAAALTLVVGACGSDDTGDALDIDATTTDTTPVPVTEPETTAAISVSEDSEPASSFAVAATGQTSCYDDSGSEIACPTEGEDFYGQDGNYISGSEMTFQDNGDGTVTDVNTGLMWQQVPSSEDFSWQEAVDHANELELGGYDDWRMPSTEELWSICDFGLGWPYVDTEFFTLVGGEVTKDEQYWTRDYYVGTTVEGGSNSAFGVNHVTGHIKAYSAEAQGPVGGKYVRAGNGDDFHGAGAVRFDTEVEGGPEGEGGERYYNFVRLVRDAG